MSHKLIIEISGKNGQPGLGSCISPKVEMPNVNINDPRERERAKDAAFMLIDSVFDALEAQQSAELHANSDYEPNIGNADDQGGPNDPQRDHA